MAYIDSQNKIWRLMNQYPQKIREGGDFDVIYLVEKVAEPYELTYLEIGKIFDCCFDMFTGKTEISAFVRGVRESLEEENRKNGGKIAEELINTVITPIKIELGKNFPLQVKEEVAAKEENLNRKNILNEIENPQRTSPQKPASSYASTKEISTPLESNIIISGKPSELKHTVISNNKETPQSPKPVGTIIEQKMNSITSLPKKEATVASARPIQKTYEKDPYREPLN